MRQLVDYTEKATLTPRIRFLTPTLLATTAARTIDVWDLETDQKVTTFETHSRVMMLEASYPYVATASQDGSLIVWDTRKVQPEHVFPRRSTCFTCCIHLDGSRQELAVGYSDGHVRVYSSLAGRLLYTLPHGHGAIQALHMDDTRLISASVSDTVKVWNRRSLKCKSGKRRKRTQSYPSMQPGNTRLNV